MRVYLDNSSLNRLFDDDSQPRVAREGQIVNNLLVASVTGEHDLVGSRVTWLEVAATRDDDRRSRMEALCQFVTVWIEITQAAIDLAHRWRLRGLKDADALHLACAELGGADVFLTCDDRLRRWAQRHRSELRVKVMSPDQWEEAP